MTTDTEPTVLCETGEHIAWLTFNRPAKRNATNPAMIYELIRLLTRINADPDIRVIVVTGAGTTYCAGADLKEFFQDLEGNPAKRAEISEAAQRWSWELFGNSPKPTIAMVNGGCYAGGFLSVLASDIAIAGSEAVFGLTEINWGHLPGTFVSKLLIETMGVRASTYYALTGKRFNAEEAARYGLVTRVVPQASLRDEVLEIARCIAEKSPEAATATKQIWKSDVKNMSVGQVREYVNAKADQLRLLDKSGVRARGLDEFLVKKTYRPGEGAVKL